MNWRYMRFQREHQALTNNNIGGNALQFPPLPTNSSYSICRCVWQLLAGSKYRLCPHKLQGCRTDSHESAASVTVHSSCIGALNTAACVWGDVRSAPSNITARLPLKEVAGLAELWAMSDEVDQLKQRWTIWLSLMCYLMAMGGGNGWY